MNDDAYTDWFRYHWEVQFAHEYKKLSPIIILSHDVTEENGYYVFKGARKLYTNSTTFTDELFIRMKISNTLVYNKGEVDNYVGFDK